jgi:HK97 family phage major capsid protein
MNNENQKQINSVNENSLEIFLNENSVNNIKNTNYEKKSYITNNENNESLFPPSTVIYNKNKFKKLSLSEFFKKIIVNDSGAHIVLESYNDEAIWRKELESIQDKKNIIPKITIPLHELASAPVISRRFMNINQFNVKEFINESVKEDFLFKIDKAILFGTGENQPKGILSYDICQNSEINKLLTIRFNLNDIMGSLINMESALDAKYLNEEESIWIISRKLYIGLQKEIFKLNNHPLVNSGIFGFSREGTINYLFNRPLLIVDGLENNKNKIEIILIHKNSYTVIENPHTEYIENQQDLDLRLFFIKYYGGGVTNHKAIVLGQVA